MDGVLLLDKPTGPTSHDVVARLRNVTRERSVGHTGTLDPMATGLLLIVFGSATRLSAHLTGGDKTYDAVVRLGFATDTDDAMGQALSASVSELPDDATIVATLERFRGTFDQLPPAHSAKKVGGKKAYDMARADAPLTLDAVSVTVSTLTYGGREDDRVRLTVSASAGFYVRALARDLGRALGCGGHLAELRRTHSGTFDVAQAIPLADAERLGKDVAARLLSPAEALAELPAVTVTELGLRRALHGNPLGPQHLASPPTWMWITTPPGTASAGPQVRILDDGGRLIALAHSRGGALHPAVVLG